MTDKLMEASIEELIDIMIDEKMKDSFPDKDDTMFWELYKTRDIWIDFDIFYDNTLIISKLIQHWNREDNGKPVEERVPIKIHICSCGGDVDVANGLISNIEASTTPVWGINEGRAYSAGAYIFLSCHKRFMMKRATFLFHECSVEEIGGHADDIDIHTKEQKFQNTQINDLIIERTNYTDKEVKRLIKHDWIIHSEEALNRHVVDAVIKNLEEIQ